MNIVCPHCQFAREVPEDRLPGAAAIATCPRCKHRFKVQRTDAPAAQGGAAQAPVRAPASAPSSLTQAPPAGSHTGTPDGHDNAPSYHAPHEHAGDDPLPPGAVVPASEPRIAPDPPAPKAAGDDASKTSGREAPKAQSPAQGSAKDSNEDEEYRKAAIAAYEREAEAQDYVLDNPWEHPQREGYFASFYQTVVRVMFAAPRFFSGLHVDTPQRIALFFYAIVTVFQIFVERFWAELLAGMISHNAGNDAQLQQLVAMLRPQTDIMMALLLRTTVSLLELFLVAGLYYLMFRLVAPASANYALLFQVVAYSSAPALLCVVPLAGSIAGVVWSVACSFVGCRHVLRLTWTQTALALAPLYLLGIPVLMYLVRSMQGVAG